MPLQGRGPGPQPAGSAPHTWRQLGTMAWMQTLRGAQVVSSAVCVVGRDQAGCSEAPLPSALALHLGSSWVLPPIIPGECSLGWMWGIDLGGAWAERPHPPLGQQWVQRCRPGRGRGPPGDASDGCWLPWRTCCLHAWCTLGCTPACTPGCTPAARQGPASPRKLLLLLWEFCGF